MLSSPSRASSPPCPPSPAHIHPSRSRPLPSPLSDGSRKAYGCARSLCIFVVSSHACRGRVFLTRPTALKHDCKTFAVMPPPAYCVSALWNHHHTLGPPAEKAASARSLARLRRTRPHPCTCASGTRSKDSCRCAGNRLRRNALVGPLPLTAEPRLYFASRSYLQSLPSGLHGAFVDHGACLRAGIGRSLLRAFPQGNFRTSNAEP